MAKKTILIMAAGMGSRYGGLKQLERLGPSGEILMEYSIYDAIQAGFDRVVFIIKKSTHAAFKELLHHKLQPKIEVDYAFQELMDLPKGFHCPAKREKPWGTTHAILSAKSLIKESFAVFNADDFYGADAFKSMANFFDHGNTVDHAMAGYSLEKTLSPHGNVTRGICSIDHGYLKDVVERSDINRETLKADLTGKELCSMNFWGFRPEIFDFLQEDFLNFLEHNGDNVKSECLIPQSVDRMIQSQRGKVKVLKTEGSWFGVTFKEDKPTVQASLRELVHGGIYPTPLF